MDQETDTPKRQYEFKDILRFVETYGGELTTEIIVAQFPGCDETLLEMVKLGLLEKTEIQKS